MLKPVTGFQIKLPEFEGPLDLLLYLIEREELDITRVSLAKVTGAYLDYIHVLEKLQVDAVADFLVVAAKLLLIKSEALLPRPPAHQTADDDPGAELALQLRIYQQYKAAARALGDREAADRRTYVRLAPPPKIEAKLDLSNVTVDMLSAAVRGVLDLEPPAPLAGTVLPPFTLTIRAQMRLIERRLRDQPRLSFQRLLRRAPGRVEIIVTFLAVLELLRRHKVDVAQDGLFGDILILPIATSSTAGDAIDDNEESEFEIPRACEEQPLAEEFKFDAPSDRVS